MRLPLMTKRDLLLILQVIPKRERVKVEENHQRKALVELGEDPLHTKAVRVREVLLVVIAVAIIITTIVIIHKNFYQDLNLQVI